MDFYVYTYLREDGSPYYVGKGTGRRAYTISKNHYPPKDLTRIRIFPMPDEDTALAYERYFIDFFGRKDNGTGTLRNLTDGGENPPSAKGKRVSEATRAKMRKPKPAGHGAAVSAGRKGMKFSQSHLENMRKCRLGQPSPKVIDHTGQRFGRLLVLGRSGHIGVEAAWLCRCNCGREKTVRGSSLRDGQTQSCGCLHRERTSQATRSELTGLVFGKLTVLSRDGYICRESAWICLCECGNTRRVKAPNRLLNNQCRCNRSGVK